MRRAFEDFTEAWDSQHYEVEEFIEVGDCVVTPFINHLQGRDGIVVRARAAFLWSIRGGVGVAFAYFPNREEALEAAGRREAG